MSSITPTHMQAGSNALTPGVTGAPEPATKKRKVAQECSSLLLPSDPFRVVTHFLDHDQYMSLALCSKSILEELRVICQEQVCACVRPSTIKLIHTELPWDLAVTGAANKIIALVSDNKATTPQENCQRSMLLIRDYRADLGPTVWKIFESITPRNIRQIAVEPSQPNIDNHIKNFPLEVREASLRELLRLGDPRQVCCDRRILFRGYEIRGYEDVLGDFEFLRQNFGSSWADLLEGVSPRTIIALHQKIRDSFSPKMLDLYETKESHYIIAVLKYFHELDCIFMDKVNFLLLSDIEKDRLLEQRILNKVTETASIAISAAENENLVVLEWMRQNLSEVLTVTNSYGWNIAHIAAQEGHLHILGWIEVHAPELISATDNYDRNIAHHAAAHGYTLVLDWIKAHVPKIMSATDHNHLNIAHHAAEDENLVVLEWIRQNLSEALTTTNSKGANIAHIAAKAGLTSVLDWIKEHVPELIRATDNYDRNIALFAVEGCDYEVLDWIKENASELLTVINSNGWNIALLAAHTGDYEVLDWIKENASELITATNDDGVNIATIAVERGQTKVLDWIKEHAPELITATNNSGWIIANTAAYLGQTRVLEWIQKNLPKATVSDLLNAKHDGWTIAYKAAGEGHTSVLEWIRQFFPNLLNPKENDWTIAHKAAQEGHTHVLDWIQTSLPKATASELLTDTNSNGWNIAHHAAAGRKTHILDWIKNNLPNASELLNTKTINGKNIATLAKRNKFNPSDGKIVLEWIQNNLPNLLEPQRAASEDSKTT